MCTDGLSNMVEDEELFHIVRKPEMLWRQVEQWWKSK